MQRVYGPLILGFHGNVCCSVLDFDAGCSRKLFAGKMVLLFVFICCYHRTLLAAYVSTMAESASSELQTKKTS